MKRLISILYLLTLLLTAGCGKYVAKAYGSSGKLYQAPDLCQAVAACTAAGENKCFYPHTDYFTGCTDQDAAGKKGTNATH